MHKNRLITPYIWLGPVLVFFLLFLSGCSGGRTENFSKPDIKDDFCGIIMNFQYCKCAFHDEYCDAVGLSPAGANTYVRNEYRRWVEYLKKKFERDCRGNGGIYRGNGKCLYCQDPYVKEGKKCIKQELAGGDGENGESDEDGDENIAFVPDGPFNADCSINESQFEETWRKYSDFDNRIDFNSRSWEAQNALAAQEQLIKLKAENFKLQRDMEIDRQIRLEVRDFRDKLVRNQKQNLVKALIRMTYLTYTTIKSGSGAGQSFNKFLTGSETLARAGGLLNTVKSVIPNDSSLAIDTNNTAGNIFNVGLSTALEALEKLGNPKDVAVKFMQESRNAAMPSASLSDEEIAILRDQYIVRQHIEHALADNYKENAERRKRVIENNKIIAQLEAEFSAWGAKEKERVRGMLVEDCERQRERFGKSGRDSK